MSKQEKIWFWIIFGIQMAVSLSVYYCYRVEVGKVNLCKGYFNKMAIIEEIKSDPKFDYYKFETNLNQFMRERLK